MEKGSKSKKLKPNDIGIEPDRFSTLPDSMAHCILFFLGIEDIARLCLTSKRCKDLCLSVPSLLIDAALYDSSAQRVRFMDFIVNFIANRRSTKLTSLTIRWGYPVLSYTETCRIVSMLNTAIQCRVNEVDLSLKLKEHKTFVIPLDFFYCESLTSLKVNMDSGKLELPFPYGFAHLECLHFDKVKIDLVDFGKWISSFCKFLKKLNLKELSGISSLKITSSTLKHVVIEKCELFELQISAESLESICLDLHSSWRKTELKVCAPNVLSLSLNASSGNSCSFGEMNLLQEASILFSPDRDRVKSNSASLLTSITQTRHLTITSECIKVLCGENCLPFEFDNLRTLHLQHSYLNDDVVHAMAKFFKRLPLSVKTLHVIPVQGFERGQKHSYGSKYGEKFWETENIMFLKGLEELKIELVGGMNEEALVEYFLKSGTNLKKVVICCETSLPTKIATKMISAAMASGANFRCEEGMMVLELKPET